MKLNQKGFGVVEGLLTIIALTLICFTGFYVYNANKRANESIKNSESATTTGSQLDQTSPEANKTELIKYDPAVEVSAASDSDKLEGASQSFKTFIGQELKNANEDQSLGSDCVVKISVSKIYKDTFASGGVGAEGCGGR